MARAARADTFGIEGELSPPVDCRGLHPRDAWQGLRGQIPSELKASYIRRCIAAGFTHIDAVSFVSPIAVPQMADAEQVLALVAPPAEVEIIGVVVNRKGAERAIGTGLVQTLGFPYSI